LWESTLATQMWSAGAGMENRYRTQDEENMTVRNNNESYGTEWEQCYELVKSTKRGI
jgi:hypothetical protein